MLTTIYALVDPRDQGVRYIGKANDPAKRLASHMRDSHRRKTPVYQWIRKLSAMGLVPMIEVIATCEPEDWPRLERMVIDKCRQAGVPLLNVADGGDQPHCPTATRAANGRKVAAARDKRKWWLMRAMGQSLKEGYVSESTKAKMRARPDLFGQFAKYL